MKNHMEIICEYNHLTDLIIFDKKKSSTTIMKPNQTEPKDLLASPFTFKFVDSGGGLPLKCVTYSPSLYTVILHELNLLSDFTVFFSFLV